MGFFVYYMQYFAGVTSTLSLLTDGMVIGWSSPTIPQLTNATLCDLLCLSSSNAGWLAVMPLLGAVLGCFTTIFIVDTIGRKWSILLTDIPFVLGWLFTAFATHPGWLFAGRLLAGISEGIVFIAVPMYNSEIAHPSIRGLLGSLCSVYWMVGNLIINIIGSYTSISTTALLSMMVPVLQLVTLPFAPESPYYLLLKGEKMQARQSLQRLRGTDDVMDELNGMAAHISNKQQQRRNERSLCDRIRSSRKAMLIMLGLISFLQFTGVVAITFYTHEIFGYTHDVISTNTAVIVYYSVQLVTTTLSAYTVDTFGRRPLLMVSMGSVASLLLILGVYFYILTETSIQLGLLALLCPAGFLLFVVALSIGLQTVPLLLEVELFETDVKATAMCISNTYWSFMTIAASKFLQTIKDAFGFHVAFWTFSLTSFCGVLYIYQFVPETKNKTLEEIQCMLQGGRKLSNYGTHRESLSLYTNENIQIVARHSLTNSGLQ